MICLGQGGDLAADGDAAGPDDIRLDDVDRAVGDQIAEAGQPGLGFVPGDGTSRALASSALPATFSVATGSSSQAIC